MKRLYFLLKQTGLVEQKENLVLGYSNGRTEHARELTKSELLQLCNYLQEQYNNSGSNSDFLAGDKMRKHIIAMAREMGWTKGGKANMERIDDWSKQQFGKVELNKYSYDDLVKLVSIFKEKVYKQFLEAV